MVTVSDLQLAAKKAGNTELFASEEVYSRCIGILNRFSINPNDLLVRLEAFLININSNSLTLAKVGAFEQILHQEFSNKPLLGLNSTTSPQGTTQTPGKRPFSSTTATSPAARQMNTPQMKRTPLANSQAKPTPFSPSKDLSLAFEAVSPTATSSGIPYSERKNSLQPIEPQFQPLLGMREENISPSTNKPLPVRCTIYRDDEAMNNLTEKYRYMFDTIPERVQSLEEQLQRLQLPLCQVAGIEVSDLVPVGIPSQDLIWVIGRLVCEAAEGKFNPTAVLLEGSSKNGSSRRVQLKLHEVPQFSVFPGQVVLVQGINSSGRILIAKQIFTSAKAPIVTSNPEQLVTFHHSSDYQNSKPLRLLIASGPFTTNDSLDFGPLGDILERVEATKPDVVILTGPFIDSSHTGELTIDDDSNGVITVNYEALFLEKVICGLNGYLEDSTSDKELLPQFIIAPSLDDVHHDFVYPQPPFGQEVNGESDARLYANSTVSYFKRRYDKLRLKYAGPTPNQRVHLVANPCMFRVNEVLFGLSTMDIVFSLGSEEVSKGFEGTHRVSRLAGHLLAQRSFVPQFPLPHTVTAPVDLAKSQHWQFDVTPDVLILPSRLSPMARTVEDTLVINPGAVTKGRTAGTFAEMSIHPISKTDLETAIKSNIESMPNAVPARTAVDILRI